MGRPCVQRNSTGRFDFGGLGDTEKLDLELANPTSPHRFQTSQQNLKTVNIATKIITKTLQTLYYLLRPLYFETILWVSCICAIVWEKAVDDASKPLDREVRGNSVFREAGGSLGLGSRA